MDTMTNNAITPPIIMEKSYSLFHRYLVKEIIRWCYVTRRVDADRRVRAIEVLVDTYENLSCCGSCEEGDRPDTYCITIAWDQSREDFVATLMHELIHINQWVTDEWEDDGEEEAESLQYEWANDFWKDTSA
jgi:hypothetical protein